MKVRIIQMPDKTFRVTDLPGSIRSNNPTAAVVEMSEDTFFKYVKTQRAEYVLQMHLRALVDITNDGLKNREKKGE